MRANAYGLLRSAVLTIGRASSRGTPMNFILPPPELRSRSLAKCFCRHLRSWALQGLKLLLGWSPSSLSAVRPRWGEVSTSGKDRAAYEPSLPPAFFLGSLQPRTEKEQGVWGQEEVKAAPQSPSHAPETPQVNMPLQVLGLSLTPPCPAPR